MAAIPFDLVFSFTAEQLKVSYLVNLRQLNSLKSNEEEKQPESDFEAEAEAEEESGNEDSDHDKQDKMTHIDNPSTATGKPKRKTIKKRREIEYDLDDPFIDDSEMNEVYRSVFDLMGEGAAVDMSDLSENEEEKGETAAEAVNPIKQPSFFVYRGPLSNEILAK